VILLPVKPPVQVKVPPVQAEAVNVAFVPVQIVALLAVMVGVVGFVTVTDTVMELLTVLTQPLTVQVAV